MAIEIDNVVSMNYDLKDANTGELLDSNEGGKALEFIIGRGQIIPGLEEEMLKLNEGDKKEVKVLSKDAYGERDDNAVQTHPREQFAGIELVEGMSLFGQGEDGQTVQVLVSSFDEKEVTVDFNHPLAGKDLLFSIEVAGVREATEDELATGAVGGVHACGCGHGEDDGCCGEHSHGEGESCCSNH